MSRAAFVTRATGALAFAWIVVTSSACGSSPEATFYALSPAQPARAAGPSTTVRSIRVRRPGLAGYLDRPEIVRRIVDHRLGIAANERWGAPLDEMVARVFAQDLELRLPGAAVFTEDGAITTEADATVEIDVRRFDVDDRGEVQLVAEVAVERGADHKGAARAMSLSRAPRSGTTGALVDAMSELLGELADRVAGMVREG